MKTKPRINKGIFVRVTPATRAQLAAFATAEGRSVPDLLREAAAAWMEARAGRLRKAKGNGFSLASRAGSGQ